MRIKLFQSHSSAACLLKACCFLAFLLSLIPQTEAFAAPHFDSHINPNDTLAGWKISLLTCAPGADIYQLEGHSALRLQNGSFDYVVNWGLFDFSSPNFVYRFVKGETDYRVGKTPTPLFLNPYIYEGRKVVEQKLNLTPLQAERLVALVEENLLPANCVYRYNYVKDNCSTRPLQMLRRAIAPDSLALGPLPQPFNDMDRALTFRNVMRYYHAHYPWYQFGIDLALGAGIDYPLQPDEAAFAPVVLEQMMAHATIINTTDNTRHPLVNETTLLCRGDGSSVVEPPTPFMATPLACALVLLAIVTLVSWHNLRTLHISRWLDTALFSLFGLAGCVIAFLVFVSVHEATSPNLILLWLNPFALMVPILIWLKSCRNFLLCYHFANFAALLALAILWVIYKQSGNWAFVPLIACDAMRSACYIYVTKCQKPANILYRGRL